MRHLLICGIALSAYLATALSGQTTPPSLTFEVVSIKLTASDAGGTLIQIKPGGVLRVTNATVRMLIKTAYDVRDFQVSGGPSWINSDRYDVIAKPEQPPDQANAPDLQKMSYREAMSYGDQLRQRLRSLFAERFKLTIHREEKDAPVYALVVDKNGMKLNLAPEGREGSRGIRMNKGQLTAMGVPMEMLATSLANQVGHPVLDKTALKGTFDFKLEWTPDQGALGPSPESSISTPADLMGPSILLRSRNNWDCGWNREGLLFRRLLSIG